jgi:phosphatidylserine decarboxylase
LSKLKNILIYQGFHKILNTRTSSRWFGKFANARIYPPVLRILIRGYIRLFKIDPEEYDFDIKKIKTFNQFFTRKLKPGIRTWKNGLCSPVDGHILSGGKISNGILFQVKGMEFSMEELTGDNNFNDGSFINIYLSPADYHRVHAPFDLHLTAVKHIPGKLLSVSKKNAQNIKGLYTKNERVILCGTSEYGTFYFVFCRSTECRKYWIESFPWF